MEEKQNRANYPSDLNDREWGVVEKILGGPPKLGRPPRFERRAVLGAILYRVRTGGWWRLLPHELPPWRIVYYYFTRWRAAGFFEKLHDALRDAVIAAMENAGDIFMPIQALVELLSGFRKGTQFRANSARLTRIVGQLAIEWIECDRAVAELYSTIHDTLRRKGQPIPTNDLWIAACCMNVGGILLTTDRRFLQVEGLRREVVEFAP